jgi:hypothetical protein
MTDEVDVIAAQNQNVKAGYYPGPLTPERWLGSTILPITQETNAAQHAYNDFAKAAFTKIENRSWDVYEK